MNLRRRTIFSALAAAGALTLGLSPPTAYASEPIALWARAETGSFLTPLVEAYNKSHERQISLTLVPDAQVTQKYSAAAATGSGPDIAIIEIGRLPQFLASGWLQDITSDLAGLPYKDALSPAHVSQGELDGKHYALPLSADVSVLYWNKALFKAAGLAPDTGPKTWDEIRSTAAAITKTGNGNFGYSSPAAVAAAWPSLCCRTRGPRARKSWSARRPTLPATRRSGTRCNSTATS
jgi:multiple sugar transport system substrate-binding protein